MDGTEGRLSTHAKDIESFRKENAVLLAKNKDVDHRSRRVNLSIRGLPELIADLQTTFLALV